MDEAAGALGAESQGQRLKRFARHAWQQFSEDRCFEEAASLSYTSLFALVPLLAVIFGIIAAFPVFAEWSEQLKSFLFSNLLPTAEEQIEDYLNGFLGSISSLTLPGTVTLIITALLLMFRIEVAFNRIWRVERARRLTNRIVMYWAVLTLGPLLIGAAIAISVQNILVPLDIGNGAFAGLRQVGIFFLSWTSFALVFVLVPNRSVPWREAIAGALLSAILFELAKRGFIGYVKNANYTVIYGALATVPIFLFWLYIVWTVVLLGASLAASLASFRESGGKAGDWPSRWEFLLAYRLAGHLHEAQLGGGRLSESRLRELEPRAGELQLQRVLGGLEQQRILARDEAGDWMLARDFGAFTLADLYRSGNYRLPWTDREDYPVESDRDRAFREAMREAAQHGLSRLERPLAAMFRAAAPGERA